MSALNELSGYCENIVYKYAYKRDWFNKGVALEDLSDTEKETLIRLCSATHDRVSEFEILSAGDFTDEIVPMFRAYLKDAELKNDFLALLTKNAFSVCSGQITEALEIVLSGFREENGYISANEEMRRADVEQRHNDIRSTRI